MMKKKETQQPMMAMARNAAVDFHPVRGISCDPNDAETLYRLGLYARIHGDDKYALELLEQAAAADPDNPAIRNSLGDAYLTGGKFDQAETHLTHGLGIDPQHKELLANLGMVHKCRGRLDDARDHFQKALAIDPDFMFAQENLDFLFKETVPYWHFSMMNDGIRNDAYERAIRNAVTPDRIVLEIGTGSGLLAMMAARAGARHVYTVEMVPAIAGVAREIVERNGFGDRITVICKDAMSLHVGEELPELADVLITETFDAGFLGEEAVPLLHHARAHLLKEDAAIIPAGGTVFGTLLESPALWSESAVGQVSGFDLRPFNKFQENKSGKYVRKFPHRKISSDFELFHFDFLGEPIRPERKIVEVGIDTDATLHEIAYWFRLQLDRDTYIDTNIEQTSCWRIALQLVNPPIELKAGEVIQIKALHNCKWIKLAPHTGRERTSDE